MSWIPLKSSNKVGTVYRIADVPGEIITGLRDADSPGGFFAREIKGWLTTEKQPP